MIYRVDKEVDNGISVFIERLLVLLVIDSKLGNKNRSP